MKTTNYAIKLVSVLCVAAAPILFSGRSVRAAATGKFTEAILQVTFSDQADSIHAFDVSTLLQAGSEVTSFFNGLSYGKLQFVVKAARVKLGNTQAYYYGHCENDTTAVVLDRCTQFTKDAVAAELKVDAHFFDGVDGVATLIANPGGGGQFSWTPIDVGIGHDVQRSYLKEFPLQPASLSYGPSHVAWQGWSHEFGHQLQFLAALSIGGKWNGHPSGYASGYDLMDSCYPCGQAAYGLLGPPFVNDNRGAFPTWLDSAHVATVPIPTFGPTGQTFVLPPLFPGIATPVIQAVQIPIDGKRYYFVNARAQQSVDALQRGSSNPSGIFDQGVQIEYIDENGDPPMTPCSPGSSKPGWVTNPSPPVVPWPYDLWHPGQTFVDNTNHIQIRVINTVTGGYTVEIGRQVPTGRPDLFITPWLTPPMNTYETVDIWIDSSCNGYEDAGGELKYGRRADGTVIGNGDDPCANHENRIYATIHNIGDVASLPTTVIFQATSPLGVGVTGQWQTVNSIALASIAPGGSATVYVPWTPTVTLTPAEIASEHFNFHSCVQALIQQDTNDVITSNKQAQENIDYFEAVTPNQPKPHFPVMHRSIALFNQHHGERVELDFDPHRMFTLRAISQLPPGWTYSLNDGKSDVFLKPRERVVVPVTIVPTTAAVGKIYAFRADAYTYEWLTNSALPVTDPRHKHFSVGSVGGVELNAHTVYESKLTLNAVPGPAGTLAVMVSGSLRPARPKVTIAIDYTNPRDMMRTRLVKTDSAGDYKDQFNLDMAGVWKIRSIWQGDMLYSSAVSPVVSSASKVK